MYIQEFDYDIGAVNDLETFSQTMECNKSTLWYDAMNGEMDSMVNNQVCDLVELPNEVKAISCKNSLGNIQRYKARLVA